MRKSVFIGVTGAICLASGAHAQALDEEPQDVRQQVAEEFRPVGGRLGSFFLYLDAQIGAEGSDNVLARDDMKREDLTMDAQAGFRLVRPAEDSRVVVQFSGGRNVHVNVPAEDQWRGNGRIYYRSGSLEGSHLAVTLVGRHQAVDREDTNNVPEARSPVMLTELSGDLAYTAAFNRFAVTAGGTISRLDVADAVDRAGALLDQDFRDYTAFSGRIEASYDTLTGIKPIVRGVVTYLNYDFGPGSAGYGLNPNDRDRDSTRLLFEAGLRFSITDRLYGDVTAGYTSRNYVAQPAAPLDVKGFSFRTNLLLQINPVLSARLSAARELAESGSRRIAGYRITGGQLRFDLALSKASVISAFGSYRRVSPLGVDPNFDEFGIGMEFSHHFSRRYRVAVQARHGSRNAVNPTFDYQANYVGLTGYATF